MPHRTLDEGSDDVMQETQLLSIFRLLVFGTPLPLPTPFPPFFLEGFQLFPQISCMCVHTCTWACMCVHTHTHSRTGHLSQSPSSPVSPTPRVRWDAPSCIFLKSDDDNMTKISPSSKISLSLNCASILLLPSICITNTLGIMCCGDKGNGLNGFFLPTSSPALILSFIFHTVARATFDNFYQVMSSPSGLSEIQLLPWPCQAWVVSLPPGSPLALGFCSFLSLSLDHFFSLLPLLIWQMSI